MQYVQTIINWVLTCILGAIAAFLGAKLRAARKRESAVQNGLMCLLRNEIIEAHDKYTDRGFCPIYKKEAIRKSYESYHDLGGNGLVTKLYEDIMKLPEEPPKKHKEESPRKLGAGGKN